MFNVDGKIYFEKKSMWMTNIESTCHLNTLSIGGHFESLTLISGTKWLPCSKDSTGIYGRKGVSYPGHWTFLYSVAHSFYFVLQSESFTTLSFRDWIHTEIPMTTLPPTNKPAYLCNLSDRKPNQHWLYAWKLHSASTHLAKSNWYHYLISAVLYFFITLLLYSNHIERCF